MNKNHLKTLPNIEGKHIGHFPNQQMLTGVTPDAFDGIRENPKFPENLKNPCICLTKKT